MGKEIFVFGSNLRGRHGAGAALYAATQLGAIEGQAFGLQGLSFVIPTKNQHMVPLTLDMIKYYVQQFVEFARDNPELNFLISPIGCGFAGYEQSQIRPLFGKLPKNCKLAPQWHKEFRF